MKVQFKASPASNPSLFPENIFEKIPENHAVRLVNEVADTLDIEHIIKQYKGGGTTSFHPRMMIKVLFYACLNNSYSCRKIEKALQENIHFMWLSGNSTPDYRTINYFRGKRLKSHIQQLFADVVRLLQELQYVSLNVQYIDGTKIESAAGRYSFVWKGAVEKNKAKLEDKIQSVLTDIASQIKQDQSTLNKEEVPKPIDSKELKTRVAKLNKDIKAQQSSNDYESAVHYYQAKRCEGCSLRGMCHQSKGNRRIEVNHKLNRHKQQARERLLSEIGLYHRSQRPVEVEAVFGQLKSNNKFSRFTLRGLEGVDIEFGLMSIGHNLRKLLSKRTQRSKNQDPDCKNTKNMSFVSNTYIYVEKYSFAA